MRDKIELTCFYWFYGPILSEMRQKERWLVGISYVRRAIKDSEFRARQHIHCKAKYNYNIILLKDGSHNTYDLLKSFFEAILSIFRNTVLGSYWVVQMQPGLNGYRSRLQCSLTDAEDLDLGCQQCMKFMLTPSGRITIGLHHSAVGY